MYGAGKVHVELIHGSLEGNKTQQYSTHSPVSLCGG